MYVCICNTFTPHIKASSHATYIMLHSLGVLQLPKCGIISNGMWYNFPMECGTTSQWNADTSVIYSHPQWHCHIQVTGYIYNIQSINLV